MTVIRSSERKAIAYSLMSWEMLLLTIPTGPFSFEEGVRLNFVIALFSEISVLMQKSRP